MKRPSSFIFYTNCRYVKICPSCFDAAKIKPVRIERYSEHYSVTNMLKKKTYFVKIQERSTCSVNVETNDSNAMGRRSRRDLTLVLLTIGARRSPSDHRQQSVHMGAREGDGTDKKKQCIAYRTACATA